MGLIIEDAMTDVQRQELSLIREFEWEARHNYINSMCNHFFDLFPSTDGCEISPLNESDSRNILAEIMITHLHCSQQAVDTVAVRQYEELGARRTDSLEDFGNQLESELKKLLKKRVPSLAEKLYEADDNYLVDISMLIRQKTGEGSPLDNNKNDSINTVSQPRRNRIYNHHHKVNQSSNVSSNLVIPINTFLFDR